MSIRRLAKQQPASFEFSKETLDKANWWLSKYPANRKQSAVIPVLWLVQKQEGWISEPALRAVANLCGMEYVRVYEVVTFYTMFQIEPVGKVLVQVCGTTPCMLRGANDLMKVCKDKIGHKDHVSDDGWFTWQEVECLGACVNAPMVQVWKDTYEDLTPQALEALIDDFAAGRKPKPGPQNGRQHSAPEGGPTTLTEKSLYSGNRTFKRVEAPPPVRPIRSTTRSACARMSAMRSGPMIPSRKPGQFSTKVVSIS